MTFQPKPEKVSALSAIRRITKQSNPAEVAAAVDEALLAQYENARLYQTQRRRQFDLSFADFLSLVTPSRRKRMEKAMADRKFERFMKSRYGYVLTWKSRKAFKAGILDKTTAMYLNREDSERASQFGPGDEHSEESKDLIRKSRTGKKASETTKAKMSRAKVGKKRDEETCAAISAGLKGKAKSPEQVEKMRASAAARWAKARAAKEMA